MSDEGPIEPRIVRPEDRDGVPNAEAGGDVYSTLASGEHTHDGYFLTHAIVPPGGGPPAHVHTREEEAFYIIRGELVFLVGQREVTASAGTFLNVPRGTKAPLPQRRRRGGGDDLLVRARGHRGPVRGARRAPRGDRGDRREVRHLVPSSTSSRRGRPPWSSASRPASRTSSGASCPRRGSASRRSATTAPGRSITSCPPARVTSTGPAWTAGPCSRRWRPRPSGCASGRWSRATSSATRRCSPRPRPTIDQISGGRLEFGIGAGNNAREHEAYGWEFGAAAERLDRLDEALHVIRLLWSDEDEVSFDGSHYRLQQAPFRPAPLQRPHPPIMVGGGGERRTLRLVAQHADAWNGIGPPSELSRKLEVLQQHCNDVGRRFEEIRLTAGAPLIPDAIYERWTERNAERPRHLGGGAARADRRRPRPRACTPLCRPTPTPGSRS